MYLEVDEKNILYNNIQFITTFDFIQYQQKHG